MSIFPNNQFAMLDGTSQASPLVAGTVLLLKEWFKKEFNREPGKDEIYGVLAKCRRSLQGVARKQIGLGYIDISDLFD